MGEGWGREREREGQDKGRMDEHGGAADDDSAHTEGDRRAAKTPTDPANKADAGRIMTGKGEPVRCASTVRPLGISQVPILRWAETMVRSIPGILLLLLLLLFW